MAKLEIGQLVGAFDPGVTTGYAEGIYVGSGKFELNATFEITWDKRFEHIQHLVPRLDWIVYERFALYKSHASEMVNNEFPSVQVIGSIQLAAYLAKKLDCVYVQPAHERKNVAVLPVDLPKVKGSQHRIDAYQHLRYFCLFHRKDRH